MGHVLVCHQSARKMESKNDMAVIKNVKTEIESESSDDKPIPSITVITIDGTNKEGNAQAPRPSDLVEFSTTDWASLIVANKKPKSKLFSAGTPHKSNHLTPGQSENPLEGEYTWSENETFTQHERTMASKSPTEILPTLFLGSKIDSMKEARLRELKITHILSVTSGKQHVVPGCKLMTVPMADNGNSDLHDVMERSLGFIEESQEEENKLLIHCHLGQNRSPTLVIAWLMKNKKMSMHDAYTFVKEKRKIVHPHKLYIEQLREYDKRLFGVYSVLPDFLTVSVADGRVNVAHENWTPFQSLQYRESQKLDPSGSGHLKSPSSQSYSNEQGDQVRVPFNKSSSIDSDIDDFILLPLSSVCEQGFVHVENTMTANSGTLSLVRVDDANANTEEDSKPKENLPLSFHYSLGSLPEEIGSKSSE